MEEIILGNTHIQLYPKEGIKKDVESHKRILQRISDIAYKALLMEKRQRSQE